MKLRQNAQNPRELINDQGDAIWEYKGMFVEDINDFLFPKELLELRQQVLELEELLEDERDKIAEIYNIVK